MKNSLIYKIKYRYLSFDELVINLDRLSRFKLPEESYFRVFSSIVTKNLISPAGFSKKNIENMPFNLLSKYVEIIWNSSVTKLFGKQKNNLEANKALRLMAKIPFKNIDKNTKILLNTKLHISPILNNIKYDISPLNIKFLIKANKIFNEKNKVSAKKLEALRHKYSLNYPINKLIISEGITEEILLPVFASKLNHPFNREGIAILGAGGKSKSPALYLKLKDKLKIPVVILFDSDASEISEKLQKNICKKDKIILIKTGEFEDILSLNLIKRSLNNEYKPATPLTKEELHIYDRMCKNLEMFYKSRHLGEYKKSKVSCIIAKNIKYKTDITNGIKDIIENITCQ